MHINTTIQKIAKITMRVLVWSVGILLALSLILSAVLMIPSVQTFVVQKATKVLSSKTQSKFIIGGIHWSFPKTVRVENVYLEDNAEDTLLYCSQLDLNASVLSLFKKKIVVDHLKIKDLKGAVYRNQNDSLFNYSAIVSAFSNTSTQKTETKEKPAWQLGFNEISLKDIHIDYHDYRDSMFLRMNLGKLLIHANSSDILNMKYDLKEIEIAETSFVMRIPDINESDSEDSNSSPLNLDLSLGKLTARNLNYALIIGNEKLNLETSIDKADISPEFISFSNSKIIIDDFLLDGINTKISMRDADTIAENNLPPTNPASGYTFGDFNWDFLVRHAAIENTNFKLDQGDKPQMSEEMDYSHLDFHNLHIDTDSVFFNQNEAGAKVNTLSFSEGSGVQINEVSGLFFVNNQEATAESLVIIANKSQISGKFRATYPSMQQISTHIDQVGIESKLSGTLYFADSKPFTKVLIQNPILQKIKMIQIIEFQSDGTVGDISLGNVDLSLANNTQIKLEGHISGLPGNNLSINYLLDTIITSGEDLRLMIGDTQIPENLHLPENIGFSSIGVTDLKNAEIEAHLKTNFGDGEIQLKLENDRFHGNLDLIELNLGSILADTTLGHISMTNDIAGNLRDFQPTQFNLESDIQSFEWNKNNIEHTSITASLLNDIYNLQIQLNDTSLKADLEFEYYKKDSVDHVEANINIYEIELESLQLLDEYFKGSGNIQFIADQHSEEEYYGEITVDNLLLDRLDKSYLIQNIAFKSKVNREGTDFYLNSDIFNASLTGNTKLVELDNAFLDHIDLYISLPDSIISPKDFIFDFNLEMKKPEFFTDFLLPDLNELQIEKCQMHYNDKEDILQAEILIPALDYQDILLKDLAFVFDTKADSAIADLQLSELHFNSLVTSKLGLHTMFEKNKAQISFYSRDLKDSLKYQLKYFIDFQDSVYNISIDHKNLVVNYEKWDIPQENLLSITNNFITSKSAIISRDNQAISLEGKNQDLSVHFSDFDLANFTEIFVQDSTIEDLSGKINGTIDLANLFASTAIESNLKISDLKYGSSAVGDLTSKIKYQGEKPMSFDITLQNSENNIHGSGVIEKANNNQNIQSVFEIDVQNANTYQPLFTDFLSNIDGAIQGRLALRGPLSNPEINGTLDFNSFQIISEPTNTLLNTNGAIQVSNNLLQFNSFFIKDGQGNPMNINGEINLRNYSDPSFDLEVIAPDFLLVNSPLEGEQELEGKLNIGINLKVKGKKSNLQVNNDLKIKGGTDIYYQLPGNELELITDEGIVEYVDFDQPLQDTVFVDQSEFIGDSIVSLIEGIDFKTTLEVDPQAKFTIVIDPNSGDFTEFNLGGTLRYTYNETQRGKLDGLLEFQSGFYELSFYGLVKKRFQYEPGSIVSWSGDVMDGMLNFAARYTVRTNSIGLVSNEISSYERQRFNQRLPYDIILKVENKISEPKISFGLDLPERYRTTYPTLDSKLNYLNQPNMESDRNRQIFALLVGGTFIPEDPSITQGSGGADFATTATRNSVNAILTQQLNNFTGKFIEGVDVDMGLNTFDDYGADKAQTRTQLDVKVSKNLFNDRVTAEMESHINLDGSVQQMGQQNTAGMTEFAVSYKITKSGNYRIKGFSENAYDIFDGEIQNSGIAFIFIREFDNLRKNSDREADKIETAENEKEGIINDEK